MLLLKNRRRLQLIHKWSFTLLSGPARAGKTSLLSEAVAQLKHLVVWLSLDEGYNDAI
jgi:ATP/maltotriose-dependent transcriptional regulator MalT